MWPIIRRVYLTSAETAYGIHLNDLDKAHDLSVVSTMELAVSALLFSKGIHVDVDHLDPNFIDIFNYIQRTSKENKVSAEVGTCLEQLRGLRLSHRSSTGLKIATSPGQRKSGIYFTPPGLADEIVHGALKGALRNVNSLEKLREFSILDPAVGCGAFLLSAIRVSSKILKRKKAFRDKSLRTLRLEVASNCIFGMDIDPVAVATTRALILAEVGDPDWSGKGLEDNLKVGDAVSSTIKCWSKWFPNPMLKGFNVIVTNPPWSKLRPLKAEFFEHMDANVRLYQGKALGQYLQKNMNTMLLGSWDEFVSRSVKLSSNLRKSKEYTLNGSSAGDPDLYKYFIERSISLLKQNGTAALLLPSGVLRAKGSAPLRRLLMDTGHIAEITEFINRKKIFDIHSMYRFATVVFKKSCKNKSTLARFQQTEVSPEVKSTPVSLNAKFLQIVGGESLLIPEVRNQYEKNLIERIYSENLTHENLEPKIRFQRELDMTNHSQNFIDAVKARKDGFRIQQDGRWTSPSSIEKLLPVYEGRMLHQYNSRAKEYISGHGRSAKWQVPKPGDGAIVPHYFVTENFARKRGWTPRERVGYCEISGHANERTVLAAIIPPYAICGNKVPVLNVVSEEYSSDFELLWLALANSLTIDWIVRRWVSTTINQFYLQNIPFPQILNDGDKSLILKLVRDLNSPNEPKETPMIWLGKRAQMKAAIDAIVMNIFAISNEEQKLILSDFPQFLKASSRSEITSITLSELLSLYRKAHREDSLTEKSVHDLTKPQSCSTTYATKTEARLLSEVMSRGLAVAV